MSVIHTMVWMYFSNYPEWEKTGNSKSGEWPDPRANSLGGAHWWMLSEITSTYLKQRNKCRGRHYNRKIKPGERLSSLGWVDNYFNWHCFISVDLCPTYKPLCFKHVQCTLTDTSIVLLSEAQKHAVNYTGHKIITVLLHTGSSVHQSLWIGHKSHKLYPCSLFTVFLYDIEGTHTGDVKV